MTTTIRSRNLPHCVIDFHLGAMTTTTTTITTMTMIQTQTKLILKNILEDRTAFISAAALGAAQECNTMIPTSTL